MPQSENLPQHMSRLIQSQTVTLEEMYEIAKKEHRYDKPFRIFRKYVSNLRWRYGMEYPQPGSKDDELCVVIDDNDNEPSLDEVFVELLRRKDTINLYDACELLECYPRVISEIVDDLRSQGLEIFFENNMISLSNKVVSNVEKVERISNKHIIFGVASDIHFGSTHCQITALNKFSEHCKSRGVKHIFCPGDIVSGYKVYPGHEHDVYAYTSKEQEDSVICNLPTGFDWYMLGGNHDYSFISKGGGHNVIRAIANERKDVHYVGFDDADIPILDGVELKMVHPSGGVAYARSYKIQKYAEQLAFSELTDMVNGIKPSPSVRFLLMGHLHIQMQMMMGPIFSMLCGTFEGQTNYLQRKGLVPNIGGYIIEASLGSDGQLKNFDSKFYMFSEIENDWTNYSHKLKDKVGIEKPIFK